MLEIWGDEDYLKGDLMIVPPGAGGLPSGRLDAIEFKNGILICDLGRVRFRMLGFGDPIDAFIGGVMSMEAVGVDFVGAATFLRQRRG